MAGHKPMGLPALNAVRGLLGLCRKEFRRNLSPKAKLKKTVSDSAGRRAQLFRAVRINEKCATRVRKQANQARGQLK